MSDAKHTPGPWVPSEKEVPVLFVENGAIPFSAIPIMAADGSEVCLVAPDQHRNPEAVINLIAAAPALLAVVKGLEWDNWQDESDMGAGDLQCPRCLGLRGEGHKPNCALDAALKLAGGGS